MDSEEFIDIAYFLNELTIYPQDESDPGQLHNISVLSSEFSTKGQIVHPCSKRHLWGCSCGSGSENPLSITCSYCGAPADYIPDTESGYCPNCEVCFPHKKRMTRPGGASNRGANKAELVCILKKAGLLNEYGRADGTAIKDISKSTLKEMVIKAGLEGEIEVEMSKRDAGIQKYLPSRNVEKEHVINLTDSTPPSLLHINEDYTKQSSDFEEGLPLNQGIEQSSVAEQSTRNIAEQSSKNVAEQNTRNVAVESTVAQNDMLDAILNNSSRNDWIPELKQFGYSGTVIIAPNKVVQLILGCIKKPEIHAHLIWKETHLGDGDYSAIMFLGTNNILALASKFNQAGPNTAACIALIDQAYADLPDAIFNATMADAENVQIYIKGLTALEKANGVKVTNTPLNNTTAKPPPKTIAPVSYSTCLFDISTLTEEEQNIVFGINPAAQGTSNSTYTDPADDYKLKQLTLANCSSFPIISPRLIESLGQRFGHALWKSKNLGVIAPLSPETLIKLAGLTIDEIIQADQDADNCIRNVDRLDVALPFNISFFGKECDKGDGFIMGQKDHMAKTDEKRNDFYIKKIWRTYCPYIKCNCQKYTRRKNECMDGGIKWFDHALWYIMNHLDIIWPNHSATVRFMLFSSLLKNTLRSAVIAYIGFLRVRSILIKMTQRYAEDPSANLCLEFGNTKLADILEKTVRPIKFLVGKAPNSTVVGENSNSKRKQTSLEDDYSDIVMPPSVFKKPIGTPSSSSSMGLGAQSNLGAAATQNSANKNVAGATTRTAGMQGTKIVY